MREYIFVFGRDPELSYLELLSYFKANGIRNKLILMDKEISVFLLPENLNFGKLLDRLGGIVKVGEIFSEYLYKGDSNKLNFGVSVYKGRDVLSKNLKSYFKKEKVKAVLKKSKDRVFTPSEVISKKLSEFIIYNDYKARTIAIFDPKGYIQRDETRPKQMLLHQVSLRLAKILINLSQARNNILDPFCGVGTILQESMLNGLDVIGVDIDRESVDASKKNLEWLKNKFNLKNKFKIIKGDAAKLTRHLKINSVEGIATEPDLGPYYRKLPNKKQVDDVIYDLEKLYYEMFLQFKEVLKKNGKIAIVIPRLKFKNGRKDIDLKVILRRVGLRVISLDSEVKFPIVIESKFLDRLIYVLEN